MNEIIKTYYESGLIESKEILKEGKIKIIIFNRNGQCTYSSTDEYETETELKLHRDHFLKRY